MKMIFGQAVTELRPGPGEPDPGTRTVQSPNGWYYSANAKRFPTIVSAWDSGGGYLDSVGVPSDVLGPLAIYVDGESRLHLRDASMRWTVVDSRHRMISTYPAPPIHCLRRSTIMLESGQLVSSEQPHGQLQHAFRVFGDGGALINAFGPELEVEPALVRDVGGQFWASWIEDSECVLALFDASGDNKREMRVGLTINRGIVPASAFRVSKLTQTGDGELVLVLVAGRATRTSHGPDEGSVMVSIGVIDSTDESATYSTPVRAEEARRVLPTSFLDGQRRAYLLRREDDRSVGLIVPYSFTK